MQTIEETLQDFLFNGLRKDAGYDEFKENDIPAYISDNLASNKTLRAYQEEAIKRFIYFSEKNNKGQERNHLLFNMATGSGKTLVMSALMLHLYMTGYRHFVFLVHSKNILTQAINSFTNASYKKYLFNQKVSFNGRVIDVKQVNDFENANDNDINIMFLTTQMFFSRVNNDAENVLQKHDFKEYKTIIIADEAHRLNVDTRKKKDIDDKKNWEMSVVDMLNAREDNMLLEFTATVDFKNPYINEKYKNKLIYRYNFAEFNKDRYSKQVRFLYNREAQIADQKRLLIVNAIALSQFRKLLFKDLDYRNINPIILVKSKKIEDSENDKEFFHEVIDTLNVGDFKFLKSVRHDDEYIILPLFRYLESKSVGMNEFIQQIRSDFSEKSAIIYNSKNQKNADVLKDLDEQNPRNIVRVVFSVNALNEGWDVLSLYDIVHFDIGKGKQVTAQDVQLIGRGARYCPFLLKGDEGNLFGTYENVIDKRKFDNVGIGVEDRKILDSLYYHFVETQTFLDGLIGELKDEGILDQQVEKVSIKMKDSFLSSETYKKGFVLVNGIEKRPKTTEDEKNKVFGEILNVSSYELSARAMTDVEEAKSTDSVRLGQMNIVRDFNKEIIKRSLISAENGFFRFSNLKKHITYLDSIDQFIVEGLGAYVIKYEYQNDKDIEKLPPKEKMQLLVGKILPEIRKIIDRELPQKSGGREFSPVSISHIFKKEVNIYLRSSPFVNDQTGLVEYKTPGERAKPQSESDHELQLDISKLEWYAYNENYGTREEKKFVKYIDSQIKDMFEKFKDAEIFLVRNELNYWLYGEGGKRFSPDYLLFINDHKKKNFYYQCIFEPKGAHLLEKDEWKENTLLNLEKTTKVVFDMKSGDSNSSYKNYLKNIKESGYKTIKNMGFAFYNSENVDQLVKFKEQFQKLLNNQ